MEYEPLRFLKWYIVHLFARNLQRKNKLVLTQKALLIIFISLFQIILLSTLIALFLAKNFNFLIFTISFVLLQLILPFLILIALFLTLPIQIYFEIRLIKKAKAKLSKMQNMKIVAVAGSFAKTSTKNILYTLLWKDFIVVKTPKSFNTLISIARTVVADIKPNTQVFIVEMDSYKNGDLTKLAKFVNPQIGIITAIGPQHLERFGTMDNLAKAQLELAEEIKKGIVLLNIDDSWIVKTLNSKKIKAKTIFFGKNSNASYYANSIKQKEENLEFDLNHNHQKIRIKLPLFGEHHIDNFLAAAAAANIIGVGFRRIQERGGLVLPTEHRLEIKKINGITFIDNTYNTNPSVSENALGVLKKTKGGKKILITPGYVELGQESEKENMKLMEKASKVADEIIVVGQNSRDILVRGLEKVKFPKQKIHLAKDTKSALNILFSIAKAADVALFENDLPDQYF